MKEEKSKSRCERHLRYLSEFQTGWLQDRKRMELEWFKGFMQACIELNGLSIESKKEYTDAAKNILGLSR